MKARVKSFREPASSSATNVWMSLPVQTQGRQTVFVLDVLLKIDRDHVAVAQGKRMRSVLDNKCHRVASFTTSLLKDWECTRCLEYSIFLSLTFLRKDEGCCIAARGWYLQARGVSNAGQFFYSSCCKVQLSAPPQCIFHLSRSCLSDLTES